MFILEMRRVHVMKNYSQLSSRGHLDINMQVYVHVLFFSAAICWAFEE